jgi:hypothetical protein
VPVTEGPRRLSIGKTKFKKEYIDTGRLQVVYLGPKSPRLIEDQIDEVVEEDIANPPAEAADTAHATAAHMRNAAERRRLAERKTAPKRTRQTAAA